MAELDRERLEQAVAYAGEWVAVQQQFRETPGIAVAIRFEDEILLSRAYGFADIERREALTPQHIFRIASHSKTFTATAVMQLVEEGLVRLDDPIGRYLPWMPENASSTTLRELLNHASGIIRDGLDADYWQLGHPFPDSEGLRSLVEAILPRNDTFKYSNIGYSLLGMAIELVSGTPYNQYVSRNIVDRLGLASTGPETDAEVQERLVTGYTGRQLPFPRIPIPDVETGAMSPATGFYSTAEDLCRYGAAHFLGNDELLSDASKREMQQPYFEAGRDGERYGLGFSVRTLGERRLVGHGGAFPGHSTRTMIDPRDRLVVSVLTNETGGPAGLLAETIVKIIDFTQQAPTEERLTPPLDRFTGRFANLWGLTDIVRFGGRLYECSPVADNPVADVTELDVVDKDTLRIANTGGYGSPGETIRYVRDDAGTVTRIVQGTSSYPLEIYRERHGSFRAV